MTSSSDPVRVVQISDIHLSRRRPFFHHNWELLVDLLANETYDLIVCTGDMSIDGAEFEDELEFAAKQFERIKGLVRVVPGNHDIGNCIPDARGGEATITSARRKSYMRYFGPDFWTCDVGAHWRLIGLNSMLLGSGLEGEVEQQSMLEEAVRYTNGRRLMLFQHKPLYMRTADENKMTQSSLYPEHRVLLRDTFASTGAIACSGHIHDYKTDIWGNLEQIWAPSTAFVMDKDGIRNPLYGVRRLGYLTHTLDGANHEHQLVEPDRFITIDLGNWFRAPETFHKLYAAEPLRGLTLIDRLL